jgi:hypothetical protein
MPRGNKQSRRFFCFINSAVSQTMTVIYMMDTFTQQYIYALYGTFLRVKVQKKIFLHIPTHGNMYTLSVFNCYY